MSDAAHVNMYNVQPLFLHTFRTKSRRKTFAEWRRQFVCGVRSYLRHFVCCANFTIQVGSALSNSSRSSVLPPRTKRHSHTHTHKNEKWNEKMMETQHQTKAKSNVFDILIPPQPIFYAIMMAYFPFFNFLLCQIVSSNILDYTQRTGPSISIDLVFYVRITYIYCMFHGPLDENSIRFCFFWSPFDGRGFDVPRSISFKRFFLSARSAGEGDRKKHFVISDSD